MLLRCSLIAKSIFAIAVCCCALQGSFGAESGRVSRRPPWTTSRLLGTPDPPPAYRIEPAFPLLRFDRPSCIEEFPTTNRMLVTEMDGKLFSFEKRASVAQADLVGDLRALLPPDLASRSVRLFDAEFHPHFADNGFLFVCYVHPGSGGHTRVSRFHLSDDDNPRLDPASEQVVITWPTGGHNAGCLEFGTDGCLYIATGDGSGPNPPDGLTTGQDVSDLLGAILRIDVDHPTGKQAYAVPDDNPFVGVDDARPEIWAYGLRNPWKFGIDPATGDTFAADNGWESWEMVHRIVRGGNCGWPVMEGRASLRSEVAVGPTPIIPPVKDHPHTEANSVIGGPVYRGKKLPDLAGSFVYGDYITGTIWAIRSDKDQSYSHTTLVDTDQRIVAFTQTRDGELFVLDFDFTGQIYELLPSQQIDRSADFPRRLSETGLFTSLADMQPAPGVMPYTVTVPRWMDGAEARRWIAIPGDGQIQLASSEDSTASYPDGTVFVKHLSLRQGKGGSPIRLETQLLHLDDGQWHPYSYLWNESGDDAYLVDSIGASRPLRVADSESPGGFVERTWRVNAVNECKLCHNAGSHFVLGFAANQLQGPPIQSDSGKADQLELLAAQGVLAAAPAQAAADAARLVDPHDASQTLDDRARSYLHANCAMCHHPGGNAIVSFYLRRELPFDKLNTNKGTGIGTFGMRDAKIIVPGDPYRSVLTYRMSKLGYARMPYIGSQVVDSAGVALIAKWIRSLPHSDENSYSAPLSANSPESTALETLVEEDEPSPEQRAESLKTLLTSTEGALSLVVRMHSGKLSPNDVEAAASFGSAISSADIRGLFETFLPESERRTTLGTSFDPKLVLDRQGDRERGKLIYFSDGARCRLCHEIDDPAKSLGPTLREINKKYSRSAELVQHVTQPSLKIDEPLAAYFVVTTDGRVVTGLLVEQSEGSIVIKTTEKKLLRIARRDIEQLQRSPKSLMPDLLLSDLTAQEAADLFEYLRSVGSAP